MSLGSLINRLEAAPDQSVGVYFDFCSLKPKGVDSYRGYYDHLALGWTADGVSPLQTVADLLVELRAAVGKTFTGYKGGDFTMSLETPVWVSQWGHTSATAICGVLVTVYRVVIETQFEG